MRWVPGNTNDKITESFFTEGGQYMDIDGVNYRGFVHKLGKLYFSGKTNTDESIPLLPYNPSPAYLIYLKIKGWFFNNFTDPRDYLPSPTEKDYEKGYVTRYFVKKKNQTQSRIIEVDEKQFKSLKNKDAGLDGNIYYGLSFRWKIMGPKFHVKFGTVIMENGVYDTNKEVVELYEKEMENISKKLSNYIQFARLK